MKVLGHIFILAATVLALSHLPARMAHAQSNDVESLNKRINELYTAEKYPEAIDLAKQVLTIREKSLGPNHLEVALALSKLADLYVVSRRYTDAEPLYQRSLAILQKIYGANNADVERVRQQLTQLKIARESEVAAVPPKNSDLAASTKSAPKAPPTVTAPPASMSQDSRVATRSARPTPAIPQPPGMAPGSNSILNPSAATASALPDFPWPPPTASAFYHLPRNLLQSRATIGEAANAIVAALERTGYVERSFYRTQADGVALVTQLESINDDGTALAGGKRWPTLQDSKDLISAVRGLFFVDRGHYRVIVFILQDRPFVQSPTNVGGEQARAWVQSGANMLPREMAERSFAHGECSVLIYEFASDGTAVRRIDSRLTGKEHLEKAGVLAYLGNAN